MQTINESAMVKKDSSKEHTKSKKLTEYSAKLNNVKLAKKYWTEVEVSSKP